MIDIKINEKVVQVQEGKTILDVAKQEGIDIPTLCHHPSLEPYGSCRVCMVKINDGRKDRWVTSCNYPLRKKIEVFTDSEEVHKQRGGVIKMLLSRYPQVPVIKDLAKKYNVQLNGLKHPLVDYNPKACILCGLCVKVCKEGIWESVIGFEGRGSTRKVTMPFNQHSEICLGCSSCADVCPTGAIELIEDPNNPADPNRIRKFGQTVAHEVIQLDDEQCQMRRVGTAHLSEIMNDYDLLPTHNYKFGSHADAPKISSSEFKKLLTQNSPDGCWLGCTMGCAKAVEDFKPKTGPYQGKSVLVDGPEYETVGGCGSNIGIFDVEWVLEINFYCDTYGIDAISFPTAMAFAMECYENGILNKTRTGGLELNFGHAEAVLETLHQISRGEGFGLIFGNGIRWMKDYFAKEFNLTEEQIRFMKDIGMEAKGLEYSEYVTKESLAMQGGYGLALKGAQHDEAWLIFMDMVNNQIPTFEDKAEALHYFPMFRTWFGLNGLCKLPWNDVEPADNAEEEEPAKVPKHVEAYVNFFSAMTGNEVTKEDVISMSERVYNFQRVFAVRNGYGTRVDDDIPYRSAGPVTVEEYESRQERYDTQLIDDIGYDIHGKSTEEKVAALRAHREAQYEMLKDATYKRRGWNENGVPTIDHLKKIGMDLAELIEVVEPLQ